jgi:hypothetical protein
MMPQPGGRTTEEERIDNSELLLTARPDLYHAWLTLIRGQYLLYFAGGRFVAEPETPTGRQ